jgi:hypothetical protein
MLAILASVPILRWVASVLMAGMAAAAASYWTHAED